MTNEQFETIKHKCYLVSAYWNDKSDWTISTDFANRVASLRLDLQQNSFGNIRIAVSQDTSIHNGFQVITCHVNILNSEYATFTVTQSNLGSSQLIPFEKEDLKWLDIHGFEISTDTNQKVEDWIYDD